MFVRTLSIYEFTEYQKHLNLLPQEDRRMRFGCPSSSDAIAAYVKNISPLNDRIFAVYEGGEIIGAAHLSNMGNGMFELGLSVLPAHRGRGIGGMLFDKSIKWVSIQGGSKLFTQCLVENGWMMRKAKSYGMEIHRECGEAHAVMVAPAITIKMLYDEMVSESNGAFMAAFNSMSPIYQKSIAIGV